MTVATLDRALAPPGDDAPPPPTGIGGASGSSFRELALYARYVGSVGHWRYIIRALRDTTVPMDRVRFKQATGSDCAFPPDWGTEFFDTSRPLLADLIEAEEAPACDSDAEIARWQRLDRRFRKRAGDSPAEFASPREEALASSPEVLERRAAYQQMLSNGCVEGFVEKIAHYFPGPRAHRVASLLEARTPNFMAEVEFTLDEENLDDLDQDSVEHADEETIRAGVALLRSTSSPVRPAPVNTPRSPAKTATSQRVPDETLAERARRRAAELGIKLPDEPAPAPAVVHDPDLVPDISIGRSAQQREIDAFLDDISIVDAYNKLCGKKHCDPGSRRDSIPVRCPHPGHTDEHESAWMTLDSRPGYRPGGVGNCARCGKFDKYDIAAWHFGYDVKADFSKLCRAMAEAFGWVSTSPHAALGSASTAVPGALSPGADPAAPSGVLDPSSSFHPIDLGAYIAGGTTQPMPTMLARRNVAIGVEPHLIYSGMVNSIIGDSGTGKSWLELFLLAERVFAGEVVMLIDMEDTPDSIISRLRHLGVPDALIISNVVYIRPNESFDLPEVESLVRLVESRSITVVGIDSLGEAFGIEGINENHDVEVGPWLQRVARRLAAAGPAVVLVDHITKAGDQPLHASGSKRKRAAIGGASYLVTVVEAFVKGANGRLKITCAKDRHGNYKRNEHVAYLDMEVDLSAGVTTLKLIAPPIDLGAGSSTSATPSKTKGPKPDSEAAVLKFVLAQSKAVNISEIREGVRDSGAGAGNKKIGSIVDRLVAHGELKEAPGGGRARWISAP